jgi:hypothetical protein
MTDEDLYLLLREEMRLYREYVHASTEEARYPARIEKKRKAWIALHGKLQQALPMAERRRILQERVALALSTGRGRR